MSLLPRTFYKDSASFAPLFRLLEDFDNYSRQGGGQLDGGKPSDGSFWLPKFDVRETVENYELHGKLPGMTKDNVYLEFTEQQTLVVRGRAERSYTSGSPPAGLIDQSKRKGQITEGDEATSHKSTVGNASNPAASDARKEVEEKGKKSIDHGVKYWLSERSVGEFSRTFNFPTPVEQNSVSASFKDGILSVTVPKANKHRALRVAIN